MSAPVENTMRTWNLHAHRRETGSIWNVNTDGHLRALASVYGDHRVIAVLVEEVEDPLDERVTHYGWEWFDKPGRPPAMVYPRSRGANVEAGRLVPWALLDMSFPYGVRSAIEAGQRYMLTLRIVEDETSSCTLEKVNT